MTYYDKENGTKMRHQISTDNDYGGEYSDIITDTLPKKDYYRSLRSQEALNNNASGSSITGMNTISRGNKTKPLPTFKPSGKNVTCIVSMLDGSEESFEIDKASYGIQLFEVVCQRLDLMEADYFGISYRDKGCSWCWLEMDVLISKQVGKHEWYFDFRVKFYPQDTNAIMEDLTRYYLCLQVRQDLITGSLRCTFPTYVILGAYVVQSEAGDHDPLRHNGVDYIRDQPFAPNNLQTQEMLERIVEMHRLHIGQSPEEADRNFLNNAKRMGLYGIDFHKVVDSSGTDVSIGVYYGGLVLYKVHLRIRRYSWARIVRLTYKGKEFHLVIRPADGEGTINREIVFKCPSSDLCKRLWKACVDHHGFFRLRETKDPKRPALMPGFGTRQFQVPARTQQQLSSQTTQRPQPRITRTPTQRKNPAAHHPQTHGNHSRPNSGNGLPAQPDGHGLAVDDIAYVTRPIFPMEQWTWSAADTTAGLGFDEKLLDTASQEGAGWQGVRSNKGIKGPGRYFYEATILEDGPVLIGWASNDAELAPLGKDKESWALGCKESATNTFNSTQGSVGAIHHGGTYLSSDDIGKINLKSDTIVGCGIHIDANENDVSMQWFVNGKPLLRREFTVQLPDQLRGEPIFPSICMKDSRVITNFGDQPFAYGPGSGNGTNAAYVPLALANDEAVALNRIRGVRMNPYDITAAMDISPNGLGLQSQSKQGWQGCRANKGVCGAGKYYYEATVKEAGGLARVGWTTEEGNLNVGSDQLGFGYGADQDGYGSSGSQGKKVHADKIENYGEALDEDDVIGCYLDLNNGTVEWSKNGKEFGIAFKIPEQLQRQEAFFPTASLNQSTIEFNFGEKPFLFPPKAGDCIPVCFSTPANTQNTRKHGPQRKKCGWSYVDPTIVEELQKNRYSFAFPLTSATSTDRHEDSFVPNSNPATVRKKPPQVTTSTPIERNSFVPPPTTPLKGGIPVLPGVVQNGGTSSKTVTYVETGDPEVNTEEYIDEKGNRVIKTTKKIKTKTTTTTSGVFTSERKESSILHHHSSGRVVVFNTNPYVADDDDAALNAAILSVTGMDANVNVLTDLQAPTVTLSKRQ